MDSGEALHAHTFSFCLVDALVDAGAPAVLALALAAFMLADAGAPAVLALAPVAVVLALLAPPLLCARPLPLCPPFRPGANGFLITVL